MKNEMDNLKLSTEEHEKYNKLIGKIGEAASKCAEAVVKFREAYNKCCKNISTGERSPEFQAELEKKKSDILAYTERWGYTTDEIEPFLTDNVLAQAVFYELSPETVCSHLIPDEAWKDMYGRTLDEWRSETLKKAKTALVE